MTGQRRSADVAARAEERPAPIALWSPDAAVSRSLRALCLAFGLDGKLIDVERGPPWVPRCLCIDVGASRRDLERGLGCWRALQPRPRLLLICDPSLYKRTEGVRSPGAPITILLRPVESREVVDTLARLADKPLSNAHQG